MNKKYIYFLLVLFFSKNALAQKENDSLLFGIIFKWKTETLELNKNYISKQDTLQINLLKFYISGIEVNYADGTFYKEKDSYHLVDFENFKVIGFKNDILKERTYYFLTNPTTKKSSIGYVENRVVVINLI